MVVGRNFKVFSFANWPILVNAAGLVIAITYQSRAFILGFLVSICFIWLLKKKESPHIKMKAALIMVLTFPVLVAFFSYFFKRDSSSGRILIYKISWLMIKDHWLFGTGYGTFGYEYLNYQANYFKGGNYTIKELLLADNTKHAFNDYLQWIAETGLPGLLILFVVAGFIIYIVKKAFAAQINYPPTLVTAISFMVAITTAACFTHVFESLYFRLVFIWSIFTVLSYAFLKLQKWLVAACIIITMFITCNYDGMRLIKYREYQKFEHAKMLYNTGYIQKALSICQDLYPDLNQDISFLSTYSELLITTERHNSILILKELISHDNSYFFHIQLADYYLNNKNPKNAESEYLKAVNMVPNRFVSRYKLFELYCIRGNKYKAQETACTLYHLPVKIPSQEIYNIKIHIRDELASRNW